MTPAYMARNDFNNEGSNCNPYTLASVEWCDYELEFQRIWAESYELEFQRIWAESQGINYGI